MGLARRPTTASYPHGISERIHWKDAEWGSLDLCCLKDQMVALCGCNGGIEGSSERTTDMSLENSQRSAIRL